MSEQPHPNATNSFSLIGTIQEINNRGGSSDTVRRERIQRVESLTGRPLLIYATAFLEDEKQQLAKGRILINQDDVIGFRDVLQHIPGTNLDVLLHSPGGYPEAAENIVQLLRSRFSSIRFLIPHMAKSAATLICCAGDELLMDSISELGPIDPQLQVVRADGVIISAPAQAIERQFDKARDRLSENPKEIAVWLPILQTYGPSLLAECDAATNLAKKLAEEWLNRWMLVGRPELASRAAEYLADSGEHLSHGRRIGINQLRDLGFYITDLNINPDLRDAIWSLYLSIRATFKGFPTIKIIEHNRDAAFIESLLVQEVNVPNMPVLPTGVPRPSIPALRNKPNRKRHGR